MIAHSVEWPNEEYENTDKRKTVRLGDIIGRLQETNTLPAWIRSSGTDERNGEATFGRGVRRVRVKILQRSGYDVGTSGRGPNERVLLLGVTIRDGTEHRTTLDWFYSGILETKANCNISGKCVRVRIMYILSMCIIHTMFIVCVRITTRVHKTARFKRAAREFRSFFFLL